MEIGEFVKSALVDIVAGVQAAQAEVCATGAQISPTGLNFDPRASPARAYANSGQLAEFIEFDLAVSVDERVAVGAGASLAIHVVSIGAKADESSTTSTVQRIRFSVSVLFPSQEAPQ